MLDCSGSCVRAFDELTGRAHACVRGYTYVRVAGSVRILMASMKEGLGGRNFEE